MSVDFSKMTADQLKKAAQDAKSGNGADAHKSIAAAKASSAEFVKAAKTMADLAKKNPDI